MSDSGLLLLDTSVVLHLIRGKATGQALDSAYGLRTRAERPLLSIISIGEMLAFAGRRSWGAAKVGPDHGPGLRPGSLESININKNGLLSYFEPFPVRENRDSGKHT